MNITEKLIQLRKSKGISQEELAEKLRVYLKTQTSYKNCTKSKNAVE